MTSRGARRRRRRRSTGWSTRSATAGRVAPWPEAPGSVGAAKDGEPDVQAGFLHRELGADVEEAAVRRERGAEGRPPERRAAEPSGERGERAVGRTAAQAVSGAEIQASSVGREGQAGPEAFESRRGDAASAV